MKNPFLDSSSFAIGWELSGNALSHSARKRILYSGVATVPPEDHNYQVPDSVEDRELATLAPNDRLDLQWIQNVVIGCRGGSGRAKYGEHKPGTRERSEVTGARDDLAPRREHGPAREIVSINYPLQLPLHANTFWWQGAP